MTNKLRRIFDNLLRVTHDNPRLRLLYPTIEALDTFFFGKEDVTKGPPHVREYMDLKRFMIIVVLCLLPCAAAGIYNFGWRVVAVIAVSYIFGVGTEGVFAGIRRRILMRAPL